MTGLAWFGLKLLGIGRWLKEALGALLRWAWHNPCPATVIALCCLCAGGWWHYSGKVEDLTATVAARDKTIFDMKAASKQAAKDQAEVNHRPAVISGQIAEVSNEQSKGYYDEGRRAGIAYANAHRVRGGTGSGVGGNPDLPSPDSAAKVDDGPGETPGMVAVTTEDYSAFVDNSLRLAKVRQDAEALIAAGVAVKSD
jgi:hypothetical protein